MKHHDYSFDLTLKAAITIRAASEAEALEKLTTGWDAQECKVTLFGNTYEFESSLTGDDPTLWAVDGEDCYASCPSCNGPTSEDGDGYDGHCGDCADKLDKQGKWD